MAVEKDHCEHAPHSKLPLLVAIELQGLQRSEIHAGKTQGRVAGEVNGTAEWCLMKWKLLHIREFKKVKTPVSSDAGPPPTSRWPYFSIMSFVESTIKHKTYLAVCVLLQLL